MSKELLRTRIGNTVTVVLPVLTRGDAVSLVGRDITIMLVDPNDVKTPVSFTVGGVDNNIATFVVEGTSQTATGTYRAEVYENYRGTAMAVYDCDIFVLVARTEYENDGNEGVSSETTTLDPINIAWVGRDGYTPYIQDGYWYINGTSTNVKAAGENGDTPYIENGYWYIGGVSTGIKVDYTNEEAQRAASEQVRVVAEAARVQAEAARTLAENSRLTEESGRSAAEGVRILAERDRQAAETTRQTQEEIRHDNEEARVEAELGRAASEASRAQVEATRVANESARTTAEATRAANEQTRVAEETDRAAAETARIAAETARETAEDGRASAEATRVSNEQTRVSNETTRQSNESARQSAETARQAAYVAAENARDAAFAAKEATRDAANQAALDCADTLNALGPKIDNIDAVVNGGSVSVWTEYDYSGLTTKQYNIDSGNKWRSTGSSLCVLVPITAGKKYKVIENDSLTTVIAILKSDTKAVGTTPDFSDSYPARIAMTTGQEYEFTAPSDANYLYILLNTSSGEVSPQLLQSDSISHSGLVPKVEALETYANRGYKIIGEATPTTNPSSPAKGDAYIANTEGTYQYLGGTALAEGQMAIFKYDGSAWTADIFAVGKDYDETINGLVRVVEGGPRNEWVEKDYSNIPTAQYNIDSTNKWRSTGSSLSVLIPITAGNDYKLVDDDNLQCVIALLKSNAQAVGTTPDFSEAEGFTARKVLAAGFNYEFTAPDDANYLYIVLETSAGYPSPVLYEYDESVQPGIAPRVEALESAVEHIDEVVDGLIDGAIIYDKPESLGVLNALKKAYQMATVKWTCVGSTMPYNQGNFTQGKEYAGIPYSSVKEYSQFVFEDVLLETFLTAVKNPRSVLYTENASSTNSTSALGRTYYGSNGACYYGSVCSGLTTYAYGLKQNVTTYEFRNWSEMEEVTDQSAYGVRLADLIWKHGHLKMVIAIGRDKDGVVKDVVTFENVNMKTTIAHYTADTFNALLEAYNGDYVIMRYKNLYQNREYVPQAQFVQVYGEDAIPYTYNTDICPNYGNKANYNEGDNVVLNLRTDYASAGFTTIEIYKDDTLLVSRAITGIDETLTSLTYGDYKARLTGTGIASDYCYFKVVNATISKSGTSFTFASLNATPIYYEFCSQNGARESISGDIVGLTTRLFSAEEIQAGEATPTSPVVASSTYRYLKVHFETEYGRVIQMLTWQ